MASAIVFPLLKCGLCAASNLDLRETKTKRFLLTKYLQLIDFQVQVFTHRP